MDPKKIKLVAFDLDGTLTQHKTKLGDENKAVLDALAKKYKLLAAIGIYYLLNMVLSFVLQAFLILGVFATAGAVEPLFSALSQTEIMFFIPLLLALIAVIVTSVALLIHYLILGKLERRLNLA